MVSASGNSSTTGLQDGVPGPAGLAVIDIAALLQQDNTKQTPLTSSAAARVAARAMRTACEDTGFFYICGLPRAALDQLDAAFAAAKQLFALSDADKAKLDAQQSPLHRGFTRLGGAHNCQPEATAEVGPDQKESFVLGMEGTSSPMHGPNVWPDEALLPGWHTTMQDYMDCMLDVSRAVAWGLSIALDLPEDYLEKKLQDPVAQLLLLRYPPAPASTHGGIQPGGIGCGEHTDCGFLTLLAQDGVPALELCNRKGEWVPAPAPPEAILVNLGDMAEAWSQGRFKSTRHRVVNRTHLARYSMPFFCNADFDAEVRVVYKCMNSINDSIPITPQGGGPRGKTAVIETTAS